MAVVVHMQRWGDAIKPRAVSFLLMPDTLVWLKFLCNFQLRGEVLGSSPRKAFALENQFDHVPVLLVFQPPFPPKLKGSASIESVPCLALAQVVQK